MSRELSRSAYWRLMRLLYHYYLSGARHFSEFNIRNGQLKYNFVDSDGNLYFRDQKLLQIVNQFVGHSLSADWRPSVTRTDLSLSGMRERAVAQAVLDAVVTPQSMVQFLPDAFFFFWAYGGVGIQGCVEDHPTVGLTSDLQAIHPCELFPFPSTGPDKTKANGLVWRRYFAAEALRDKVGARTFNRMKDKLKTIRIARGEAESRIGLSGAYESVGVGLQGTGFTGPRPAEPQNSEDSGLVDLVEVREAWIDGEAGFCDRYVVQSGDAILIDEDYEGKGFYRNLRYVRCLEDGTWHGQGICDLLFPYVREKEKMLSHLLENIRSMSSYDLLVLPQSQFDQQTAFRDVGRGLRICTYSPDPFAENARPTTVRQATSGEIPGKASVMLDQMIQAMAFPEILQGNAPGRVDSAQGLEFLDEQARKALNAPTGNLQTGLGAIYQAMVCEAVRKFSESKRPIPVSRLSLDMAGVVLSADQSKVTFTDGVNPLPDPSRLVFTVKNSAPKSPAALKQEAVGYLTNQQITIDQFQYYCVSQGIDVAMPLGRTKNAYEKAVRNILVLFADGQTPGQVVATPYSNVPTIDLQVLEEFMASVTFSLASPAVQTAFMQYMQDLQTQLGTVLPAGYQNPDDVVIQRQADMAQQGPPPQPQ